MSKILSKSLILILLVSLFIPFAVDAVTLRNPIKAKSFTELLNAIVSFLMMIAIPLASIMIVVAGFYFVTSVGEPEKIQTAKRIILWTLIGLIVILSAWGFIKVIENIFK